ncbi:vinorine synthase-like [Spinacia oleracea]|uniref:Vinorine synthase-like n=1 Tax=Spinacia oleracea TaxID=3562 RepID=A0A9R0IZU1_SPIOL|nr:vinorine synthase-like [Spinacia oleracea]
MSIVSEHEQPSLLKRKKYMELQVEIVSRETIRPETPTLPEFKHYKLSLLDQLSPLVYGIEFTCYAPPNNKLDDEHCSIAHLKKSLSKALSRFYPLAGRLTADESTIDCNDEGTPFVEDRCKCPLSLFLHAPYRVDMANQFLPSIIPAHGHRTSRSLAPTEMVPFAVQVSIFDCGGVIIGTKGLHKILDAASCGIFLKMWSDLAKGLQVESAIDITTAISLFPPCSWAAVSPPREPIPLCALEGNKVDGTCVVKVFEFNPDSVATLQAKARSDLVPKTTRIEAVSGFIWKHVMAAAATASGNPCAFGPSVVTHAVNIRSRTSPKLSPTTFGNLVVHGIADYKGQNGMVPKLSDLVTEIWRALADVKDADFLTTLQGKDGGQAIRRYKQNLAVLKDQPNISIYRFTSWSKLGMNPDFGFGMPLWSGHTGGRMSSSFKNLILLILNPGHQIEASLILDEKEMYILQSDPHFLQFASLIGRPHSHTTTI